MINDFVQKSSDDRFAKFGKLFLKTLSNSSDWYIQYFNPTKDTKWYFVDENANIIDSGVLIGNGEYQNLSADLSANTGVASLYINVDELGNGIDHFQRLADLRLIYLDLSILPNLYYFKYYYGRNDVLDIKVGAQNFTYFYIPYTHVKSPDFLNNIQSVKYLYLYNTKFYEFGIFNINRFKNSLCSITILDSNYNIQLDTTDFRDFDLLYSFKMYHVRHNQNFYFKNDKILTIYLSSDGNYINNVELPQLANKEIFDALNTLYLSMLNNQNYIDINSLINDGYLPVLNNLYLYHFDYLNVTKDLHFKNNNILSNIYLGYNSVNSVIFENLTDLEKIYLKSIEIDSIDIDDASKQKLWFFYCLYLNCREVDLSNAPLASLSFNYSYYKKFNLKNVDRNLITTFSGHTYYNDACYLVDNPNDWANDKFRSGDILTNDEQEFNDCEI